MPKVLLALSAGFGLAGMVYLGVMEARRARLVPDGTAMPEFPMERYLGGSMALEELRGKVVMLDFWATWCGPCQEEMPSLVKLAKEYEGKGLAFVAASRDDAEIAPRVVDDFVKRHLPDLGPYVVYASDEIARAYRVEALPTLYFLDRDGKVTDAVRGSMSEAAIRQRIERALKR
ncbi:TlpA family protein disulfide reductase [Stigmatella aurantiaca]|uniref:Cytochrome C biogenesis protein n=1 Tax=Stigmatella aurantiaca (strain DW4/3-1) TaxID=378806 RepID=Q09BW2_STIAD|nr:TlpA disulfide reductase family protein [Stigmatella aurantiaca]ADO73932.1 Thiol-disulfide oxidoreductase ResA [Stigmatella aurantiaca DW4/3-1]EAU69125.1 cytochrome C biogenesis protein [Stigmatella aurantiaca DW4/3-1]